MSIAIGKDNYESEVMKSDKPVLIDFWASWCGPCKMMSPVVEELSDELQDRIKVCKVNVDEEPEIASEYSVMSIPTIVLIKDGHVEASAIGARPKEEVKNLLGI